MQDPITPVLALDDLPDELLVKLARSLPPNDAACVMRRLSKRTAAALHSFRVVHLSQPSPPADFAARWGQPGAVTGLNLHRQRQLFALTAKSGCVANLRLLVETSRLPWVGSPAVLAAALEGQQLEMCRELSQRLAGQQPLATDVADLLCRAIQAGAGPPLCKGLYDLWYDNVAVGTASSCLLTSAHTELEDVWSFAASHGRLDVCRWVELLGPPMRRRDIAAACAGGLVPLVEEALELGLDDVARNPAAWQPHAPEFAAAGGHRNLVRRLLRVAAAQGLRLELRRLAAGAAYGLSLADMVGLLQAADAVEAAAGASASGGGGGSAAAAAASAWDVGGGAGAAASLHSWREEDRAELVCAAASSPTADWAEKVTWLVRQGCTRRLQRPADYRYFSPGWPEGSPARRCSPAERFRWLRDQGFDLAPGLLTAELCQGCPPCEAYTLAGLFAEVTLGSSCRDEGNRAEQQHQAVALAAACLHAGVPEELAGKAVRALLDGGWINPSAAAEIAVSYSQRGLDWWPSEHVTTPLVRRAAEDPSCRTPELFCAAAELADLPLMQELGALGCGMGERAWEAAQAFRCEGVLRWLELVGCPRGQRRDAPCTDD